MMLTDFLLARIAEDEAAAPSAVSGRSGAWASNRNPTDDGMGERGGRLPMLLEERPSTLTNCRWEQDDPSDWIVGSPILLRHLAAVYADHPDYDESWRP